MRMRNRTPPIRTTATSIGNQTMPRTERKFLNTNVNAASSVLPTGIFMTAPLAQAQCRGESAHKKDGICLSPQNPSGRTPGRTRKVVTTNHGTFILTPTVLEKRPPGARRKCFACRCLPVFPRGLHASLHPYLYGLALSLQSTKLLRSPDCTNREHEEGCQVQNRI